MVFVSATIFMFFFLQWLNIQVQPYNLKLY